LCYARALTTLERRRVGTPAMAMGSNGGSMLYRIQRLLGTGAHDYAPSKLPGIAAMALGLVCLALTLRHARGQEQNIGVAVTRGDVTVNLRTRSDGPDGPGVAVDLKGSAVRHRAPDRASLLRRFSCEGAQRRALRNWHRARHKMRDRAFNPAGRC
jgi:hypothetical protein